MGDNGQEKIAPWKKKKIRDELYRKRDPSNNRLKAKIWDP